MPQISLVRTLTTAFVRRRNKERYKKSAEFLGETSADTLSCPWLFHAKLIGEAALRPAMPKAELADLIYYMEGHRKKGKRRVSLMLTDTQVTVNDMKSARRLSHYPLEDVRRICVDSIKEKTFGFVVRDSRSEMEHFLCFRTTVKGTSHSHNGHRIGSVLAQFKSSRSNVSPPTSSLHNQEPTLVTVNEPQALSGTSVEKQSTPPHTLSKPPMKREASDDVEAVYENLTFHDNDPIDVALQKAFFVRQYHNQMQKKVQFMKKYYQYPTGADDEELEDDDSEDLEGSDWDGSDESVETNEVDMQVLKNEMIGEEKKKGNRENTDNEINEGYMDLVWKRIMQRKRVVEDEVERKEENRKMGDTSDTDIENKERHMDLLRRAIMQRRRALYTSEKSDEESDEEEKEEKEEKKWGEEEEQHIKYCFNKHEQQRYMSALREALMRRQRILQDGDESNNKKTKEWMKTESSDSEESSGERFK